MSDPTLGERLDAAVTHLARRIGSEREDGGLDAGDRAMLRRFDGRDPPLAFWRLIYDEELPPLIEDLAGHGSRPAVELAFATLLQAMAHLGPLAIAGERDELGAVLARTGYSEARFVRLLRAEGADLARELVTAARWCGREGQGIAWPGTARLVLAAFVDRPFDRTAQGHRQARAYYATQAKNKSA